VSTKSPAWNLFLINYSQLLFTNKKYMNPIATNKPKIKTNHPKALRSPVIIPIKEMIMFRESATKIPVNIARCSLSEFLAIPNITVNPSNAAPKRLVIKIPLSSGINPRLDNTISGKIRCAKLAIKNMMDAMM